MFAELRAFVVFGFACAGTLASAATYYVDAMKGNDNASGTGISQPWRTLSRAQQAKLQPGDRLLLAAGMQHQGQLHFDSLAASSSRPTAPPNPAASPSDGSK
jgi:hypothetical protein